MKRVLSPLSFALLIAAVVMTAGFLAAACGGSDEQAKADLSAALVDFETAVSDLQKLGATSTVADLKKANEGLKAPYDKVVETATKVPGADVAALDTAWKALQDAIAAVPDDSSIVMAAIRVTPKIQPVVQAEAALKALVTPSK
jgi:hypothetical protein